MAKRHSDCRCRRCLNSARGNMYIIDFLARVIPPPRAPAETQRRMARARVVPAKALGS